MGKRDAGSDAFDDLYKSSMDLLIYEGLEEHVRETAERRPKGAGRNQRTARQVPMAGRRGTLPSRPAEDRPVDEARLAEVWASLARERERRLHRPAWQHGLRMVAIVGGCLVSVVGLGLSLAYTLGLAMLPGVGFDGYLTFLGMLFGGAIVAAVALLH